MFFGHRQPHHGKTGQIYIRFKYIKVVIEDVYEEDDKRGAQVYKYANIHIYI